MLKGLACALALGWTALPVAATAQDGAKLDCVVAGIDADLKQSIARSVLKDSADAADVALFEQFGGLAQSCIARHGIADSLRTAYLEYSLSRILREWSIAELGRMNLPVRPIDTALDFGPGRSNPDVGDGITEEQMDAVAAAYAVTGIDLETVGDRKLELVGIYISATTTYWSRRKALSL